MADKQRGFSIGVFKAEMANKRLLRPNLFHVEFNLPTGLQTGHTNFNRNYGTVRTLEYWCEASSLSGFALNTYQGQRYGYGPIEQRPILPAYGEQQFMFIMDQETLNYDFFNDWLNIIVNTDMSEGPNDESGEVVSINSVNPMAPYEISFRDDYVTNVSVIVYDSEGNAVKKITLRDAFPKTLGEISLAWSDNNTYMRLPVSLAYTDWYQVKL